MKRVLFVEDEPEHVEGTMDTVREQGVAECEVVGFDDAVEKITDYEPDVVILDLMAGQTAGEQTPEGLEAQNFVWERHFCPLIVHSAYPEQYTQRYDEHPFVKVIKKGRNSRRDIMNTLEEFDPHISALKEAQEYVRQAFSTVMKDVAPYAFTTFTKPEARIETIKRAGRRRLAAIMDGLSSEEDQLASWEKYLCPPVTESVLLGDVLMKRDGEHNNPNDYRVVLTPSCDMTNTGKRRPKVNNVLVAKCLPIGEGLALTSLKEASVKKLKSKLPAALSHGYFEAIIPLPELPDRIPAMAVNLRSLELLALEDLREDEGAYKRLASIDSPFRELISWAYMHTACRPGLPDRDLSKWVSEIVEVLETNARQAK